MNLKFNRYYLTDKAPSRIISILVTVLAMTYLIIGAMHLEQESLDRQRRYYQQRNIVQANMKKYIAEAQNRTREYALANKSSLLEEAREVEEVEEVREETVMYVNTSDYSNLNVRSSPDLNSEIIGKLEYGSEVSVFTDSINDTKFFEITFDNKQGYVYSNLISETKPAAKVAVASTKKSIQNTQAIEYDSNGNQILNSYAGVVQGPSGKETYYNLDMSGIVKWMHDLGIEGDYWVREDGVKMLGDFIMVAANLKVHPRGSIVETSLGTGRVCDTGSFAYDDPTQLDIATTWE